MKKFISVITAAIMLVAPVCSNAFAAGEEIPQVQPDFIEFNKNDVSGAFIFELPENSSAKVIVTFESPEDEPGTIYYEKVLKSEDGLKYSFPLEGFDNQIDADGNIIEGRLYSVEITVEDTEHMLFSKTYKDENISVPTGEDDGVIQKYSFYTLKIENTESDKDYTVSHSTVEFDGKTCDAQIITFYVDEAFTKGDVNDDTVVDAKDASLVLSEYALLATGGASKFSEKQKKAADVNNDTVVDAKDASKILFYYATAATGGKPSWD